MGLQRWRQFDFSLGVQEATTWLLKKPNELARGINLRFTEEVGGFERRPGFVREGNAFAADLPPQGGHVAKFSTGSKRLVAVNNSGATATIIRVQDSGTGDWSDLSGIPAYPIDAIVFFLDYLDEVYVSGFDPATGDPIQPCNIDKELDVSVIRNLRNCPSGYFFAEYLGLLYIANVTVGSERKPDRVYKSSPPLGAMTFIQGAQVDPLTNVTLVDNVPAMTNYTVPSGVALASSEVNASNRAWQAFDDNPGPPSGPSSSRWISATTTGWLRYDFGAGNAKIITHYSIVGENSSEVTNRGPKSWTFEGSNDGTVWTAIDTRTNQPTWNKLLGEKRGYSTNNITAYRYYRLNISANQGADYAAIQEFELLTSLQAGPRSLEVKLDSVRYVKAGTPIDVYKAGTDTKLYDIDVVGVDKVKNTITFNPYKDTVSTAGVNTTDDSFLVVDSNKYPAGTPIRFTTTSGLPAPLATGVTYYSIILDSTHIKLATSLDTALLNNPIDITTTGAGTHYLALSYQFSDNDEIWLDGTKGKLNIFWNTDYPTPQSTGEYLAVKPGTDSSNVVTAIGKSSNRLFIFTRNSGTRWDGQNLVVFNNNVGCISQRSIANLDDDWLIYMDSKGNIRARNENTGQAENISRGIRNRYLRKLTQAQMKATDGDVVDTVYKIHLGTINGEYIRVCYDFDANTWSPERLGYPALIQMSDDYSGSQKPYFLSSNGRLYVDEVGNKDDDKSIPFEAGTGRDMYGSEAVKTFHGVMLFTKNCNGLKFECAVDNGKFHTMGRIEGEVCWMKFPENGDNKLPEGVSLDWQIIGAGEGDPPKVEGTAMFYAPREGIPSERRPIQ